MNAACENTRFADDALQESAPVLENRQVAQHTYQLSVEAPGIAERIVPGQFVMLRLAGFDDPLLGRPLALYDTLDPAELDRRGLGARRTRNVPAGRPAALDVVYLAQGKLTTRLARFQPGQWVELWGPLGNGFRPATAKRLIMVAGGIGQTPFLALAREALGSRRYGLADQQGRADRPAPPAAPRVTLCYGARTASLLAGVEDFEAAGVDVRLATDDGSRGHHGRAPDLVREALAESAAELADVEIVACGPEPMLAAVAGVAAERGVRCAVSLETPMACGVGICFSCVTRVKEDGGWDYKRTCVEGPVFDAAKIAW